VRDVEAPRRAQASPLSLAPGAPDPYRTLFPLGALLGIAGAVPWVSHALAGGAWPGPVHRALMVQGFELCFVLGFLLTALPALTRGPRCRPWELWGALGLAAAFGAAALAGAMAVAHAAFGLATLHLGVATVRRTMNAPMPPAEEFAFVVLGLAFGLVGAVWQAGFAAGAWGDPAPNFGSRLVSLGMVLPVVLGVGALLVPAFVGLRDPLTIPGIARPHARAGRRRLYRALGAAFVAAFVLEAAGLRAAGAWTRAAAALALLALAWKVWRLPGRRDLYGWALWSTGWLVGAGLLSAAVFPLHAPALLHLVFLGGFGLLTLGIGTRVVVMHGGWPGSDEARLFTPWIVGAIVVALALRLAAEWAPGAATHALGAAGALWTLAWVGWLAGALPRVIRRGRPAPR
jgi:uncharacterized protein involved in response to NO